MKFKREQIEAIGRCLFRQRENHSELNWLSMVCEFDAMFIEQDPFYSSRPFLKACGYNGGVDGGISPYRRYNNLLDRKVASRG